MRRFFCFATFRPSALTFVLVLFGPFAANAVFAAWNPAGNPVCAVPGYQSDVVALPFGSDLTSFRSMFLCWSDARDTVGLGSNIYFDIVDPLGSAAHSPSGTPLVVAPG